MLDIEIYLDILEFIHAATSGEGVEVLFRILNRYCEAPKQLVITQSLPFLIAARTSTKSVRLPRKQVLQKMADKQKAVLNKAILKPYMDCFWRS